MPELVEGNGIGITYRRLSLPKAEVSETLPEPELAEGRGIGNPTGA